MEINQNKPKVIIRTNLIFYEEPSKSDIWGSNDIIYEIIYNNKQGIVEIDEIGAFGDRKLVKRFWDKRKRGIKLNEMLENIQEMANMTYAEFKELINN